MEHSTRLSWKIALVSLVMTFAFMISGNAYAQALTGTKTVGAGGDYTTLEAAITALNVNGVGAGGVTFNVAAGHTETFTTPTAGTITATGTLANPIVFQKNGVGANPLITAATPGTGTADGIIKLVGSDYVTIDGIDVQENAANTTATERMEWGYALLRVSGTDGSQYNVIKNCSVTLEKANTATNGIYSASVDASGAAVTVTDVSGANSNNKIYGNTVSNAFYGIYVIGYNDATPYTYHDQNNEIGVTAGNTISNFGGSSTHAGIYLRNNNNFKISNNIITNSGSASTLRGIYLATCSNASGDVNGNDISLSSSAATNQLTGIENGISGTGTINIFNNNIHDCKYPTATTGPTYLLYNNAAAATVNIYENTIANNSSNSASGAFYCIYNASGVTNLNIYENEIFNDTTAGTGAMSGIQATTTITNANIYSNEIYNIRKTGTTGSNNLIGISTGTGTISIHDNIINDMYQASGATGAIYGIYDLSSPTNESYYSNEIFNLTHAGTGTVAGIYVNTTSGTRACYDNIIYSLSTAGSTAYGMYHASSSPNIYKNNIYNITANAAGAVAHGIYISSGTTVNIYNNFVSDIKAPAATSTNAVNGIYIGGGTTVGAYYNTVYLNATSSSVTTFGTSGIYASTSPTVDLRNNLVVNASTAGPTGGLIVAYRRSGTTLTTYSNNSNNNAFYAGTPSATNLIYTDGTNSDQTLAEFKTRVSPRDANSITENAPFVNVATTPYDLHLKTDVGTQLESGGTSVTSPIEISDDFDGNLRNATTPDIGADEGNFMMLDISAPGISYTALSNTASTSNRTLTSAITDPSGVPTTGIGLPVLYWKINEGSWTSAQGVYQSGTNYQFTFGTGVVAGDSVMYYIVAQDEAGTPNVGAYPAAGAGSFTANPPAAGTPPTNPSKYYIIGSISGTKTVGTGGDYATLTAAFSDLNSKEITGPVVFSLLDPEYSTTTGETFPLNIYKNNGSSSVNTVTIKPAVSVSPVITGSTATSVLRLIGADYIIIDGSNQVDGSSRDLTIYNSYTGGTFNYTVGLFHDGTKGATNNTIKNCVLRGIPTVTNSFGVILNAAGGNFHNTSIINNAIKNAKIGIQFVGVSGAITNNGIISGNIIGDATEPIKQGGISMSYVENTLIAGNEIFGEAAGNANYSQYGISIGTGSTNSKIRKNIIHDFYYTGTGGWGNRGIYYNSDATTVTEISNNMIYNIKADGDPSGISYTPAGILVNAGGNLKIYYNSIFMNGATLSSSYNSHSAGIVVNTGTSLLDMRNNIIKNSMTPVGGTATHKTYAVYSYVANTAYTDINYNDYFVDGINPNVGYLGSDRADLTAWQTATTKDANSISGDPGFVSATDLHIDPYNASVVGNAGTPLTGVVDDDIDGDARSATTPDIGADEYMGVTPLAFDLLSPAHTATDVPVNGFLLWETSTYATSYDVYLDAANPPVTLLGNVADTTAAYSLASLSTYYWKVVAKNGNGEYESGVFSFTTGTNPPASPSALTFDDVLTDTVALSWTDNATDEDGFRVYRSTELNGTYTNESGDLDSLVGTGLTGSFIDDGVAVNTKYYYKVVAYSVINGESAPALDSIATLANIPGTPILSDAGVTTMKVTIDPNGNSDWTEYSVRVAEGMNFYYLTTTGALSASQVWGTYADFGGASGKVIKGLTPETEYTVDVVARNLNDIETDFSPTASLTTTTTVYPITEGFEGTTFPPAGWAVQDLNAGNTWIRSTSSPHTGSASAAYPYHGTLPANDWLFSPALVMDSGAVYKITYWYKANSSSYAEDMKVSIGLDQTADSMTTVLADHPGIVSTTYLTNTIEYVAPASGVYFVGFHCYSIPDRWNLFLDDITISPVYAVDYGITGISMVDGIPPVMLKTGINDIVNKVDGEMLNKQKGVERSDVNNSRILSSGKSYQGKLKAVANDKNLTELKTLATEDTRDITMRFTVANFGIDTTKTFELAWDVAGTPQTGYTSTTGITNDGSVEVDLGGNYAELGTHTTNATITVADDENLTNNDLSFYRTLIYPDTMLRIQYDNGTNVQSTFIGANGPPFLAGVRFTASADMQLTNIDGLYRNEASTDSITVQIWAAGATNDAPGALLYTKNFGGENYISAAGDYITIPLGDEAPVFASGTDFWVSIGFANVPYPMGAHNTGFTAGRSFYSMDAGATWNPLVITTERAWLMRVVGVPYYINHPPAAFNLLTPADETFISVDATSADTALVTWTPAIDPNGDPVSYYFMASLNELFTDSIVVPIGADTSFKLAYSDIDQVLANWGVADGDTADIYWTVIATDGTSEVLSDDTFILTAHRLLDVGVENPDVIPTEYALHQNFPNPFNPTTTIKYDIKEPGKVTLKIYNLLGQEVRTLVNTNQNIGKYNVVWDGKNNSGITVSTGLYIYRIQAGNFVKSHKMMLLK